MENYLDAFKKIVKKEKGTNIIICLSILFLYLSYKIVTGNLFLDSSRLYNKGYTILPKYEEVTKTLYKLSDYIICFSVLLVLTFILRKSNKEWFDKQNIKLRSIEEVSLLQKQGKDIDDYTDDDIYEEDNAIASEQIDK